MNTSSRRKSTNTAWYRFCRHPRVAVVSILLVLILAVTFCYLLGILYPQLQLFNRLATSLGFRTTEAYNFYSGQTTGAYYAVGNAIAGKINKHSRLVNRCTSGGSENGMKLTIEKNSFGLIQEELINHDDQLRKNVKIVTPLFLERMHIFYRKDLFAGDEKTVQVAANSDLRLLKCLRDSSLNVNMGPVGSGTRIIASYVMAVLQQQMNPLLKNGTAKFNQVSIGFDSSIKKMKSYAGKRDKTTIDILFYMLADPIDYVKDLLDLKQYQLMSIDPSFVVLLNREFDLNLRVADFKGKYKTTNNTSTFGTLTLLIASRAIEDDVAKRVVEKIHDSKHVIHTAMIHNHGTDSTLALNEFGFYNVVNDEYDSTAKTRIKEFMVFLLSVLTLFFPVFRSILGLRQVWQRWDVNKNIDLVAEDYAKKPEEHKQALLAMKSIKADLVDLYGEGLLKEAHYTALCSRIEMYEEKFSDEKVLAAKKTRQLLVKALRHYPLPQLDPSA